MISVSEALHIVKEHSLTTKQTEVKPLLSCLNQVLSEDINSAIHMPPFRQSAMDGYALHLHDTHQYNVIDEIQAGDHHQPQLKAGEAVRIFTGAPVPDTANAVIMQEKTTISDTTLVVTDNPTIEQNIRPKGEQVAQGEIALNKGTLITPATIGFLASLGFTQARVYKKAKVAVIATGNELIAPGNPLTYGKIYESNTTMLVAALNNLGYHDTTIHTIADNYDATLQLIKQAMATYDTVILSGGISVGDYDFVGKALNELQVEQLFYKVKQKPGKPLYFGKHHDTLIFALPGNPAAALTCFYHYVYPSLQWCSGVVDYQHKSIQAKATNSFIKKGDRAQFLKAFTTEGKVTLLEGQSSAMLQTFAVANALVFLQEDTHEIKIDDTVTILPIP